MVTPAVVTLSNLGRNTVIANLSAIAVTVAGTGATYNAANGGLPFDLASILNTAQPNDSEDIIQPADIIDAISIGPSANGFFIGALTISPPSSWVQNTAVGSGYGSAAGLPAPMTVRPDYTWASVPAWIQLFGSGSGSGLAFAQFANGVNSDTITFLLLYARGGANL